MLTALDRNKAKKCSDKLARKCLHMCVMSQDKVTRGTCFVVSDPDGGLLAQKFDWTFKALYMIVKG